MGAAAMVVPEFTGPATATTFVSRTSASATVMARCLSALSSFTSSRSLRPPMPPAAFTSLTASSAPLRVLAP